MSLKVYAVPDADTRHLHTGVRTMCEHLTSNLKQDSLLDKIALLEAVSGEQGLDSNGNGNKVECKCTGM